MRGAACKFSRSLMTRIFLLTRLMRGAAMLASKNQTYSYISTHAPHARRGLQKGVSGHSYIISTHAPHARRGELIDRRRSSFLISTHAPHARRGCTRPKAFKALLIFLLTRLMRGAAMNGVAGVCIRTFLLTRLMRGAAYYRYRYLNQNQISTHAPHARRGESEEL